MNQNQYTQGTLHKDVLHLPQEDEAIFQLKDGWHYDEEDKNCPIVQSTPLVLQTNDVTTFTYQLLVPKTQQIYSLNLDGIHQPFELWVNGQLTKTSAMPAPNKLIHFYVENHAVDIKLLITPLNERIAFLQTPIFGQTDAMQSFLVKQLLTMLVTLICLTLIGIYSLTLYFSKKQQVLHLQIGIYFLLVSVSLFLSSEGIGAVFLPFSQSMLVKLKTISGLLAAVPLYFIVASLNNHVVLKVKMYLFLSAIAFAGALIFTAPLEIYRPVEIIIWGCLIYILFSHLLKAILYFVKNKNFAWKNILLINTLFYLVVYLILRVYYNVWGTDLPTILWLIIFAILICLYLTLQQNQLMKELEKSKREAVQSKISFFNAQIKPHFLYNALSNIMALCYTDNLKAAHLLGKFSTYLRLIFENNDWISLEKELTLIDAYVEIEKARFPEKIHYILEVEPHVKASKIPTLSIQPFVENAIRHGLFNKENSGTVHVKIERQPHALIIMIQDDGVGMTAQTVMNILSGKHEQQGIGILNVVQRLQLIENSHFLMQSDLNKGTSIMLKIPIPS